MRAASFHQENHEIGLSPGRNSGKMAPTAVYTARKDRFPLSCLLRRLGKFAREGREFGGTGPQGRNIPSILCVEVAAVGWRAPAFHRGPFPGPNTRESDDGVRCAWVRGTNVPRWMSVREKEESRYFN
jgi:hypothetical protein